MIPALASAAKSTPASIKETCFAIIASFANVAMSGSKLCTKHLNTIWVVNRGSYDNVGSLLVASTIISITTPTLTLIGVRITGAKTN